MNTDTCIVSVAFREPYVTHSKKQREAIYPDVSMIYFHDQLPMKGVVHTENIVEEFQKSLYGFKPHAIQFAIDSGFKKVIWFDPSVLPTTSVQVLIDSLDTHPIIVRTGDAPLSKMCNKKAKDWFRVSDDLIKDVKHVGGTIYCFNFNDQKAVDVFNLWKRAEEEGIFQDQDAFMKGDCWADESAFALSLHSIGVPQYYEEKFTYANLKELPA